MSEPPDLLTDAPLYEDTLDEPTCEHRCEPMAPQALGARGALANHTEADGFEDMAMTLLMLTVKDLEGSNARDRHSARSSVVTGGILPWLDQLPISAESRARVICLLENLASQVSPYKR